MKRPLRVLELRSVKGAGGGPEKTILHGAAIADRRHVAVTVCYLRDARDHRFAIDRAASHLDIDYVEIQERHSFDPSLWRQLRRLVRERAIDLVHAHDYKTDFYARLLASVERVTPLATVHGWTGRSWKERLFYYPADRRVLESFPRLIAVSSEIQQCLVKAGVPNARITKLLNGIDADVWRRPGGREADVRRAIGLPANAIVIGSVGRLEAQKRYDLLIEAIAALRPRLPDLQLVIAGAGSRHDQLEAQARECGVPCRLLGLRADVAALHLAFDLFVQSSDYEGTANALLEAMALETPVVATDVGGTSEVMRSGVDGLLVPAGDAGALATAIEQALADRGVTARRAQAARERIEREFSFERRTRALETIYREVA